MTKRTVDFFRHNLDDECLTSFNETARTLFITSGPKTAEFEKAFGNYLGLPYAVGLMSCTHALHMAFMTLGIGKGDEVIVPALTFVATATTVLHAGATPVFADVDPDTGILDPERTEAAITPRTKAICPVHLYGVMSPMHAFADLAQQHDLKLIEDAAHCIEGRGPDFGPGTLADAVAFSFYATKNITCGEGGALATKHEDVYEQAKIMRLHGMSKNVMDRHASGSLHYDVGRLGFKCNLNDLQASLLIPQIARIEKTLAKRAKLVAIYNEGLKETPGLILPTVPDGYKSALHLYTIRVADRKKRDMFMTAIKEAGIGCAVNFNPLASLSLFREQFGAKPEAFPNAAAIGFSTITLPLYPAMPEDDVLYVVDAIRKLAKKLL